MYAELDKYNDDVSFENFYSYTHGDELQWGRGGGATDEFVLEFSRDYFFGIFCTLFTANDTKRR